MHKPPDIRRSSPGVSIWDRRSRRNEVSMLNAPGKYKRFRWRNLPKCQVKNLRDKGGKQTKQAVNSKKPGADVSRKKVLILLKAHISIKALTLRKRIIPEGATAAKEVRQKHLKYGTQKVLHFIAFALPQIGRKSKGTTCNLSPSVPPESPKVSTKVQTDLDQVQMNNLLTSPLSHTAILENMSYLASMSRNNHLESQKLTETCQTLRGKEMMNKDRQQEFYGNHETMCSKYQDVLQENGQLHQENDQLYQENN